MALNSGLFSEGIEKVIKNASKVALRFGSNLVGTEHILYGLSSVSECTASKILESYNVTENVLFQLFEESASGVSLFGNPELTPRTKELFQMAQIANDSEDKEIEELEEQSDEIFGNESVSEETQERESDTTETRGNYSGVAADKLWKDIK